MKINQLLGSLTSVKRTGPDHWVACCPAHEDRMPSLAITVNPDTVLIHCFAGCSTEEILGAVGMSFDDLYPEHDHHVKPRRIPVTDAMRCIGFEALVVVASAGTMRQRNLTPVEMDRLSQASGRIQAAIEMVGL